jgi:hypothetical protein
MTHALDIKRTREETLSKWVVTPKTKEALQEFRNNPDFLEVEKGKFRRDYVGTFFVKDGNYYYWDGEDNVLINEELDLARRRDIEIR